MKKILVLGATGSGKTRLSACLSQILTIPVSHWDTLFYQDDGTEAPSYLRQEKLLRLVQSPKWILDGASVEHLPHLLEEADTVLVLDTSRWSCLKRVLSRFILGKWRHVQGCQPRLNRSVIEEILHDYPHKIRPEILALKNHKVMQSWRIFPNYAASKEFLELLAVWKNVNMDLLVERDVPALKEGLEIDPRASFEEPSKELSACSQQAGA